MSEVQEDENTSAWRLDKRIPVMMLGGLLLQSFAVGMYMQSLNDRIIYLERTTVSTEQYGRIDEKMSRLKDDVVSVKNDLQNIKDDIRRMAVRGGKP